MDDTKLADQVALLLIQSRDLLHTCVQRRARLTKQGRRYHLAVCMAETAIERLVVAERAHDERLRRAARRSAAELAENATIEMQLAERGV